MNERSLAERIHGVAGLDHPVTQSVYRLLAERAELSRDAAATALELPRSVAAFHLDKLADAGLAVVHFERLTGRTGPGAGRTAKIYRRADTALEVSLPERRYDLVGDVLADAVERSAQEGEPIEQAVRAAPTATGPRTGHHAYERAAPGAGGARRRDDVIETLVRHGYEPSRTGGDIVLVNCPFHALAEEHRDLVCAMNLDLISGIIDGAQSADRLTAWLAPEPGQCCVRLHAS